MKNKMILSQKNIQTIAPTKILYLDILKMNNDELESFLQREYEQNPILNRVNNFKYKKIVDFELFSENDDWKSLLKTDILNQIDFAKYDKRDIEIMEYLVSFLDDRGFFSYDLKDLEEYDVKDLRRNLNVLKKLEPFGVFSRDIGDFVRKQLVRRGITDKKLLELAKKDVFVIFSGNITGIKNYTGLNKDKIKDVLKLLSGLRPYPIMEIRDGKNEYVVPDVVVKRDESGFKIEINDGFTGEYSYDDYYMNLMQNTADKGLKKYLQEKRKRARYIVDAIESRRNTIIRIVEEILGMQEGYFLNGAPLKPMKMCQIAKFIDMDTSTVSRAIRDKYMQYEDTFLIKELFTTDVANKGVSSDFIKNEIRDIIANEDVQKPFSDEKIVRILLTRDIVVSRRAVAKYRDDMGILNSTKRRLIYGV